jgi:hypothetical protein
MLNLLNKFSYLSSMKAKTPKKAAKNQAQPTPHTSFDDIISASVSGIKPTQTTYLSTPKKRANKATKKGK